MTAHFNSAGAAGALRHPNPTLDPIEGHVHVPARQEYENGLAHNAPTVANARIAELEGALHNLIKQIYSCAPIEVAANETEFRMKIIEARRVLGNGPGGE